MPRAHSNAPTVIALVLGALAATWLGAIVVFYSSSSASAHHHHRHHRAVHTPQEHAEHDIATLVNAESQRRIILCETSKGPFRIVLSDAATSPKATKFLSYLVDIGFWSGGPPGGPESKGVAFFRVNEWITQFGAHGKAYKVPKAPGMNYDKDGEVRDLNAIADKKKRIPFKRGDMNLLGGTQFTIVRKPNKYMGVEDHDTVVGHVPEEDMRNVIDKLYAYNDIIDHPHRGPGPDQTRIYAEGWAHLEREFPLVDRITACRWAA